MDDALIQRAQQGDRDAFHQLVEQYSDVVWRTIRVLLADPNQVEDIAQEAWIDVWLHLRQFRLGHSFRPWLLAIVANRCRKALRRLRPSTLSLSDEIVSDLESLAAQGDIADHVLRKEQIGEIRMILAALPLNQQRVLTLHYFADLSLAEIATVLNVPDGTVKTWLHRALHAARIQIQEASSAINLQELKG